MFCLFRWSNSSLFACNTLTESVAGPVTVKVEKAVGQDFEVRGVWLECHVERGTFPQYSWFLNNKRLESKGSFYKTFHTDHSALVVLLHPRSGSDGDYSCEAVNSFDNTTSVSSPSTLISHEGNSIFTICCAINTEHTVHRAIKVKSKQIQSSPKKCKAEMLSLCLDGAGLHYITKSARMPDQDSHVLLNITFPSHRYWR